MIPGFSIKWEGRCGVKAFQILVLLFLIGFIAGKPVHAELYEYIDENGVRSYTDDPSVMTVNQRKNSQVTNEIKTRQPVSPAKRIISPKVKNPSPEPRKTYKGNISKTVLEVGADQKALDAEAFNLKKIKQDLDKEYSYLQSEKQRLTSFRDELKQAEDVNDETLEHFRKQINTLNQKTAVYEKRLRSYLDRVSDYNQKIK